MKLTIRDLNLQFASSTDDKPKVLDHVSLELEHGEFIVLTGDSGSGKTQLAFALARLQDFQGGILDATTHTFDADDVHLDLTRSQDLTLFRKKYLAYIFQEPYAYFDPVKTIRQQLAVSLDDTFIGWMKECDLNDQDLILDSYPHQLSGGELQRLSILEAVSKKPAVIVADEIESSLDTHSKDIIVKFVTKLHQTSSITFIWITHELKSIFDQCTRIWKVKAGKLIFDGLPSGYQPAKKDPLIQRNTSSSIPLLEIIDLSKSYKNKVVLDKVTFTVYAGELIGLQGDSGSGKSTLARILSGYESADLGVVLFNGKPLTKLPTRSIMYVFQDAYSSLNPFMTAEEILLEALNQENKHNLTSLIQSVQFPESLLKHLPGALSGGLRQRLALARAMAQPPSVLILDESLNALDTDLQNWIMDYLSNCCIKNQLAIIIISHDEVLLKRSAQKIYSLSMGKLNLVL